jgi:hypothetical protein
MSTTRFAWPLTLLLVLAGPMAAHAEGGLDFDMDGAPKGKVLDVVPATISFSCANAAVYGDGPDGTSKISLEQLTSCYGAASQSNWQAVRKAANAFAGDAKTYYSFKSEGAPTEGICQSAPATSVTSLVAAKAKSVEAAKNLKEAQTDRDKKKEAAEAANVPVVTQQAAVDAAGKLPPNKETQALVDKLAKLKQQLAQATAALEQADASLVSATTGVAEAEKVLASAEKRAADEAANLKAVQQSSDVLRTAIDSANASVARSPEDFEALLDDPKRMESCLAIRTAILAASGSTALRAKYDADQKEQRDARAAAHRADLLRKAESAVSGVFSGNGFAEQPGSPDKVIFSVMSALGADSRTTGTQLVMTLNLASLLTSSEDERLGLGATWRNLTLRANLPLEATDNTPVAGSTTPTQTSAVMPSDKADVTRVSAVIGSSLADNTDQRLGTHNPCYQAALAYRPIVEKLSNKKDSASERVDYYDICHRRAAYSARWAWRFGAGFITPKSDDKTRLELWAAAAVWGPTPWVYVNAFHQHVLEPARINVYGLGASFGGNVGGRASGVDSWARVSLDVLGLYAYTYATDSKPAVDDLEFRITPSIRTKVLGNAIAKLGVGPRILKRNPDHPAIMASLALTYDADALIDQALVSPTTLSGP